MDCGHEITQELQKAACVNNTENREAILQHPVPARTAGKPHVVTLDTVTPW